MSIIVQNSMAPQKVILMSCGSYNPPTNMHLRMFEIARDHLHRMGTHEVIGGVVSPVNDAYFKKDLVHSDNRIAMLKLALQSNDWIRISTWETRQNMWIKTLASLTHHQNILNSFLLSNLNGIDECIETEDAEWIPECITEIDKSESVQIKLLCGADLLESFAVPNLWHEEDIDKIVGQHGLIVVTREGSDPNKFIYDSDVLSKHMHNIFVVTEWIPNEISSTKIRRALKRGESVKYLLQDSVIDYTYNNGIYDYKAIAKIKSDYSYDDSNECLCKDFDTALTRSSSNLAITPISLIDDNPDNSLHCIFETNLENSSQDNNLSRQCSISNDKSGNEKQLNSSDNSNQVPTNSQIHKLDAKDFSNELPGNEHNKLQKDMTIFENNSNSENEDIAVDLNSSKANPEDSTKATKNSNHSNQHCLKTETSNFANDDDDLKTNDANPEIDGKYIKSLVNSKKSPKKISKSEDESRKSRRKERSSRKSGYHSASFRHRRYQDDNSDDDTNTIVRSSIAKKPLMRVSSMLHNSLNDNASPSIYLQGSLDSIKMGAVKNGTGIRLYEINSKKSKSYESIKRSEPPKLSLVSQKVDQSNIISQSDSTSKLITTNDFDLPTEEFCSVCYLPNDPSSTEIFYTVTSNCSSPVDDDSTKCDICSWNLQVDSDIPEQSIPDSTYETCEICGEPASSLDVTLNQIEEKCDKQLNLPLNKLSIKREEGDSLLDDDNIRDENFELDRLDKKIDRRYCRSLTEPVDLQNSIIFVPKDEIAMGKSGKKFNRKSSSIKKLNKSHEKRLYASVDNLQYSKSSYKIYGDKLANSKETKHMASSDNIRNSKSYKNRSLRRSVDNIERYDTSGDNLGALEKSLVTDNVATEMGDAATKLKSDIKMILTQHGIKIIGGKETVL